MKRYLAVFLKAVTVISCLALFVFFIKDLCYEKNAKAMANKHGTERIIFLHHSTGNGVYNYGASGGVAGWISNYNTENGTSYQISERWYPAQSTGLDNAPYNYWNLWVNGACSETNSGIECLSTLVQKYDVIIFKHCLPTSDINADTGNPDVTSDTKSLENYKLQYRALRNLMDSYRFANKKFIVWTTSIPPITFLSETFTAADVARGHQFVDWVKNEFLTEDGNTHPNISIFDWWSIVADTNSQSAYYNYLKNEYATGGDGIHPNDAANEYAGPLFAQAIIDAIDETPTDLLMPWVSPSAYSFTLDDIYNRLVSGATATAGNHLFAPSASPAGTSRSLAQLYYAIPSIDASQVLYGATYIGVAGTYRTANLTAANVRLGTTYATSTTGTLTPAGGTATVADLFNGRTDYITADWTLDTGALNLACNTSTFNGTTNLVATAYDGDGDGTNRWCITNSGTAVANQILNGLVAWVDGVEITGTYTSPTYDFGDDDASKVLTTATGNGGVLSYNASNLSTSTVKKGTAFGVSLTGAFSGYPGTGWVANGSGSGSTALNQANCEAAHSEGGYYWKWFEDGNSDGDQTDPEDGVCVLMCTDATCTAVNTATWTNNYTNSAYAAASWNGAEQIMPNTLVATAITEGSSSTAVVGTPCTADAYKYHIARVEMGAIDCWGKIKSNTTNRITVYGSWLIVGATYDTCATAPGVGNTVQIYDEDKYDTTWIGDWSCAGNFPTGTVSWESYPTSAQVGGNLIALATADCLDGKRDLLPTVDESISDSRIVYSGTAEGGTGTTLTDSDFVMDTNSLMGQKVKIFSGASAGSEGIIESNTTVDGIGVLTVSLPWAGGSPDATSQFVIIYIVPAASYSTSAQVCGGANCFKGNNGPLRPDVLANWKGTRLPSQNDFYSVCGSTAQTTNKSYGTYGGQIGRSDEYLNRANSANAECTSERVGGYHVKAVGWYACSDTQLYTADLSVANANRFRVIFRP